MKKIITFLLALCMLLGMVACSGTTASTETAATETAGTAAAADSSTAETATAASDGEVPTVKIFMCYYTEVPADQELVCEKLSEYTREKIGCNVEITALTQAVYSEQINLLFTSDSDPYDLVMINNYAGVQAPVLEAKGALMACDALLDEYGQGVKEACGDYLDAGKVDGNIYEIPCLRTAAVSYGFLVPKEYIEKFDIDVDSIHTQADMTAVFEKVSALEPDMTMIYNGSGKAFTDPAEYDSLGDQVGVLDNRGSDLTVVNLVETEQFAEECRLHSEWYQKGYIAKDVLTNPDTYQDEFKAGKLFCTWTTVYPGVENSIAGQCDGMEFVQIPITDAFAWTSRVTTYGYAIPYNSTHADYAMKFLNLMYTDEYVLNTLCYGIEGTHYVKVEGTDNMITFPEGVDSSTSGYYPRSNYLWGNIWIAYTWEGDSPDLLAQQKEYSDNADQSKAMGFVWDVTPVKTEYTAVSNVNDKYLTAITNGVMDYDTYIDEYVAALKDAGLDTIIAEKQSQLDAWAQANGIN